MTPYDQCQKVESSLNFVFITDFQKIRKTLAPSTMMSKTRRKKGMTCEDEEGGWVISEENTRAQNSFHFKATVATLKPLNAKGIIQKIEGKRRNRSICLKIRHPSEIIKKSNDFLRRKNEGSIGRTKISSNGTKPKVRFKFWTKFKSPRQRFIGTQFIIIEYPIMFSVLEMED